MVSRIFGPMHSPWFYVDYAIHFLMSHSRHGTHSPFVYRLVDEVIYAPRKGQEPLPKVERLITRLIGRFTPDAIYRIGDRPTKHPVDFVIADVGDLETVASTAFSIKQLWPQFHAGSVLVLIGIYRNKRMKALWRSIQMRPDVTVTIDLFHLGLVFFHKGQAKENFRIRF